MTKMIKIYNAQKLPPAVVEHLKITINTFFFFLRELIVIIYLSVIYCERYAPLELNEKKMSTSLLVFGIH